MSPVTERTELDGLVDKCGVFSSGEVATILEESGTISGLLQYRLRTTLYQHMPFADAELFVYKPESREKQSVYFACNLAGKAESWKIAAHGRTYNPDNDLLPGAMRDEFYAPLGAELHTKDFTAMMQCLDAPVLHPSSPELFSWHKERHFAGGKANFFWHLYHNFLITDCPAWQEVRQNFRFRLFLPSPGNIPPPMESMRIF